jgi:5'(3')-deoxyribonucleotidase
MKRKRIGVDVDGVLANFVRGAITMSRALFPNANISTDESLLKTWDFKGIGLTTEQEAILWACIHNTQNFWQNLTPLPSTSLLPVLAQHHDLIFVTNRLETPGNTVCKQTERWLKFYFDILNPYVICAGSKGEVCQGLRLAAFIDDKPENIEDIRQHCGEYPYGGPRFYLKTATYNTEAPLKIKGCYFPVSSFNEFAVKYLIEGIIL